jgi:hypothetical protein
MDIMQDLMVRYIKLIGTDVKQRAELCNRTQPDLMDLQSTFDTMGINVDELSEYVEQFDCKALVTDSVPIFPQPTETHLNHLKPGSREVLHRPNHIYDYLPPMYPEMEGTEDENMPSMATSLDENKIEIKTEAPTAQPGDSSDLHPLREIASVIMTSSGFVSETREGRMADAKTPIVRQMSVAPTTSAPSQSTGTGNSGPSGSGSDHTKTPQGPTKAKPSKPADETDSEGIIEDSDEDDFKSNRKRRDKDPTPEKQEDKTEKQDEEDASIVDAESEDEEEDFKKSQKELEEEEEREREAAVIESRKQRMKDLFSRSAKTAQVANWFGKATPLPSSKDKDKDPLVSQTAPSKMSRAGADEEGKLDPDGSDTESSEEDRGSRIRMGGSRGRNKPSAGAQSSKPKPTAQPSKKAPTQSSSPTKQSAKKSVKPIVESESESESESSRIP